MAIKIEWTCPQCAAKNNEELLVMTGGWSINPGDKYPVACEECDDTSMTIEVRLMNE